MTLAAARIGVTSPYKGLNYYAERDARFFFGRETLSDVIASNLLASRLTLLYGPSGVGKSSLLRAGVARHLRQLATEDAEVRTHPGFIVVVFPGDEDAGREGDARRDSWRDDPGRAIAAGIERTAAALGIDTTTLDTRGPLPDVLRACADVLTAQVLLVLDQFEEYFLYHPRAGAFDDDLVRALTDDTVSANVLLSIREDAYARLDRFKGRVPFLYDNYLRVDHLTPGAARAAILRPLDEWNRELAENDQPARIENDLVDAVLAAVETGSVLLGQTGRGGVAESTAGTARIETPFLQLVLERIWAEERRHGSSVMHLSTLEQLGGAQRIVLTHLDAAMQAFDDDQKAIAARAFRQLVTPSGTKIAHLPSDLADMEVLDRDALRGVLERLAEARILRPIAPPPTESESRYEIFHDVLGPAVLDWRGRYEQREEQRRLTARLAEEESDRREAEELLRLEQAQKRRFRAVAGVAALLALVAVGLALWAFQAQRVASKEEKKAQARGLLAKATAALPTDPTQALRISLRAVRTAPSDDVYSVLRRAALASHLSMTAAGRGAVLATAMTTDGRRLVVVRDTGSIETWDPRTAERTSYSRNLFTAASQVARNGATVATNDGGPDWFVWDVARRRTVATVSVADLPGARSTTTPAPFSLGPDGRVVAYVRGSSGEYGVTIGSLRGGRMVRKKVVTSTHAPASLLEFDLAGDRLLAVWRGGYWRAWDVSTGRLLGSRLPRNGRPTGAGAIAGAYSGTGHRVAVATADGVVAVSSERGGRPQAVTHIRPGAGVTTLAFGPGRRPQVAFGLSDGSAELWTPYADQVPTLLAGHTASVTGVAFSRNGRFLATSSDDETVRVWDAVSDGLRATMLGHTDAVTSVDFADDDRKLVTGSHDGSARVWRIPSDTTVPLPSHRADVVRASFSSGGRRVVTMSVDGTLRVAEAASGRPVGTFRIEPALPPNFRDVLAGEFGRPDIPLLAWVPRGAMNAAGTRLVAGNDVNGTTLSWQTSAQTPPKRLGDQGQLAEAVIPGVGPNRRWIAVVRGTGSILLVDGRTGAPVGRALDRGFHRGFPLAAAATADGRLLVADEVEPTIGLLLWDIPRRKLLSVVRPPHSPSRISFVAIDPAGRHVAGGTLGGTIWVWRVRDRRIERTIKLRGDLRTLAFSPDGQTLAAAGDSNTGSLWPVVSGNPVFLRGHIGGINTIRYSPDGAFVTTSGDDGTVRVWEARNGELRQTLRNGERGRALDAEYNPRGTRIVVAASDGSSEIVRCVVCGDADAQVAFAERQLPVTRK